MTTNEPSVTIGDVSHSTFAIGSHARAESRHQAAERDPAAGELLAAVRELRADLARIRADERIRALDEELAGAEEEIDRTGTTGRSRRQRLRELLADAQSVLSLFTSAGTVAELLAR
ncbi:hypothetical protein STXM2123_2741 [Streptomyces sp. F-3]|uniref:Uncharacterized protein n=1 Tax=Streptomyces thermogriseus TaxID=75292 RepID=A0ABP4DMU4_9ACTN|nr:MULTISPECIES: hypothetical protein [unclassified Streptomyces]MDN5381690.1 hypothetical protein [Streptomyces sp. LB8]GAT82040.1 hypothetical protein STXM2123_2741 [Streptomyces sp. F-3]